MANARADDQQRVLIHLVERALQHLEELGYSERTRKYYRHVWKTIVQFICGSASCAKRVRRFAPGLLSSRGIRSGKTRQLTWSQEQFQRGLRILIEFQETGAFRRHAKRVQKPLVPRKLLRSRERYELFCRQHLHHSPATIARRRHALTRFFVFWVGTVSRVRRKSAPRY
jgi:hypothetical protein